MTLWYVVDRELSCLRDKLSVCRPQCGWPRTCGESGTQGCGSLSSWEVRWQRCLLFPVRTLPHTSPLPTLQIGPAIYHPQESPLFPQGLCVPATFHVRERDCVSRDDLGRILDHTRFARLGIREIGRRRA